MLEMPSGTGKTVSLLSLIVAYQMVSITLLSYWLPTRSTQCGCVTTISL